MLGIREGEVQGGGVKRIKLQDLTVIDPNIFLKTSAPDLQFRKKGRVKSSIIRCSIIVLKI